MTLKRKNIQFILIFFVICSCATSPPIPEIIEIPALEQLLLDIKNPEDIKKYYILNRQGNPIVKADITGEIGDFEVTYFIEEAELLDDNTFNIRFILKGKDSDIEIEDTFNWKPSPRYNRESSAGLLLSMDDNFLQTWENYFDLFDKYNARITFFVQGRFNPFMNRALGKGHDIGYHSLNHRDIRGMSNQNISAEVIEPARIIRNNGIPLLSFAFPYGFSNQRVREILSKEFRILRGYGTTIRFYNDNDINSGYIISYAIDNTVFPNEERFNRLISIMLRTVKFLGDGWVLPLTTHDISNTASWGIAPRRLEFVFKTAADLNLQFYCYSDFIMGTSELNY